MLGSQRALFDIPREVAYFNAAGWSPLPLAVQEAGRAGVALKGRPWELDDGLPARQHDRARRAAAALIGADPADIALIPSISYGVAVAGKLLPVAAGSRVLVLKDDHSSPVLEWMARAETGGFAVEPVAAGADGDWTAAVLEAIARPGAAPLAVASVSSIHWSDGGLLDMAAIGAAVRRAGAALVVDATHEVGAMPVDVRASDPDFLMFPTYKWTLGPYGRAFLYVAKRRQDGVPLEQTGFGRRAISSERVPYFADLSYVQDARRFDMGERDHFVSLEMAATGMEMMAEWGPAAVSGRLGALADRLAEGLAATGATALPKARRAPHVLGVAPRDGDAGGMVKRLAAAGVHTALRVGRVRISPHVYNDEADIERLLAAWRG